MARMRTVHPEQWTDEDFCSLSPMARLLCIGIRNFADDNGIFPAKAFTLKVQIFPADTVDVAALLAELLAANAYLEYDACGAKYGLIRNFHRFQRPDKPNYKYPIPAESLPDGYAIRRGVVGDRSESGRRLVADRSGGEMEKEMEMEMEKEKVITTPPTPHPGGGDAAGANPEPTQPKTDPCPYDQIGAAWNRMAKAHGLAAIRAPGEKRKRAMKARWSCAWFRDHWQEAMSLVPQSPWHMGKNESGWTATFDWFLRPDAALRLWERHKAGNGSGGTTDPRTEALIQRYTQTEAKP